MGCASSVPGPDLVNDEATSKPSPRASRTSRSNQSSWSESTGKKQRKVLDDTESTSTAPAEAPTSVIPIGPAPPGDGRNLVLIAWDIENVRLPLNTAPGLSPRHIVRYLKKHFIYTPGRTEYRTVAAVTERSLNRIRRDHPAFVEHVVPDLTLLMASAVHAKRNADVMLKKELHHFTTEHAHLARAHPGQLTIVLISGDEDFLEPVQGALQAGFNVELLTHDTASGALMAQGYSRPPGLWSAFLRGCSGVQQLVLPYGDEQMHSVLGPRSLVLAGFGHRRGGELARAIAARMMRAAAAATAAAAHAAMNGGGGGSGTAAAVTAVSGGGGGGGGSSMSPRGVTGNTTNSSSFSSGEAELVLVEPSFGDFSGTCCVVAAPPPGLDAAALAAGLRQQAAAAAGPEPRLLVFEARRVLRLTLQADDAWVPASGGGGGGSIVRHPNASGDDAAAVAADGVAAADADVEPAADAAADARAPTSFSAATSGRSLHDRMLDACERLAALLRIYRLPLPPGAAAVGGGGGGGGSPHQQHHQHHPHAYPSAQGVSRQLHVLCRFSRAPGPGELTCTVLCAAAAAAEAADLLHALSHLRGLASELMRHHGVALHAECMFAAAAAAAAATVAASTAVPSPGATLVLAPAGPVEEAEGAEGPAVPAAVAGILPPPPPPPRRRLPALSFQPTTYRQAVAPQQQQQHVAVAKADSAVGAETAATAHGEGLQGTQQCQPQQQPLPQQPQHANGHGLATHESSPAAPIPMVAVGGSGAPPVADGLSSSDEGEAGADGKKKKKKKKKRKKKKKHKKNSVVPAP
ncbi:hypothetical protein Agub_g9759 [Astrephomene gubernaculifera]|uniref:NYN domain-containing protein n=1 Tax=Astrephomene gubernaculifera TaxID=47775 RepID=A0AAD3DTS1_9CHLO|nr:hypothetical protein Agub_g9759 [Astrephomene gubernaculifera]